MSSYLTPFGGSSGTSWVDITTPTGAVAQTLPRALSASNASPLASGRLTMVAIGLTTGQTIHSITFVSNGTAASVPTNQWFALYDSSLNKLGVTSDDTTTAWAGNAAKTLSLTQSYSVPTSGLYYLGICVVATTVPTLTGAINGGPLLTASFTPVLSGTSNTGLTNPASAPATATALTVITSVPYAYVS